MGRFGGRASGRFSRALGPGFGRARGGGCLRPDGLPEDGTGTSAGEVVRIAVSGSADRDRARAAEEGESDRIRGRGCAAVSDSAWRGRYGCRLRAERPAVRGARGGGE